MKSIILMATHNGEKFLHEQLSSINDQTFNEWDLMVSDDHSSDGTSQIISDFKNFSLNNIRYEKGPGKGFVHNFFHLVLLAPETYDLFFFSDQDDVWINTRMKEVISLFKDTKKNNSSKVPTIYFSNTALINQLGIKIKDFKKNLCPSFSNALIESAGSGNTMVLNKEAFKILKSSLKQITLDKIVSHDWWAYQVITGSNGTVIYDKKCLVQYRQHSNNLHGSNALIMSKLRRLISILKKEFSSMLDRQLSELIKIDTLSQKNRDLLIEYQSLRKRYRIKLMIFSIQNDIQRSKILENIAYYLAIFLKRS